MGKVFKRKLYDKMLDWKQTRDGSTALLIKGARRVGKSTIAEEFAKTSIKAIYSSTLLMHQQPCGRLLTTFLTAIIFSCNFNLYMV